MGIRHALWQWIKTIFTLRWQPGQDTAVALATAFLMVPGYYFCTHASGIPIASLLLAIGINGVLNVLLPAYYMLIVRREGLDSVGITTRRLGWALGISIAGSLIMWKGLQRELPSHPEVNLAAQLLFNGVILWEPFFVFGWLQLRFERALGLLPGILLAAASFAAYHLGTYPLSGVVSLGILGVVFGILFRMTRNIFTLWPLTWSICSSIGTLQGGMTFQWHEVLLYAAILLVQLSGIAWMVCRREMATRRPLE